jgi:GrpB-like predicted nucleotidyltransferase (UPF0157 family)
VNPSEDASVEIAAYDPAWPSRFAQEGTLLLRELAPWLTGAIEHIGSTAVPGLAAKPVIDIMAGVESLSASRDAIAAAERCGYLYAPYRDDVMHWFCKPSPAFRTHHLHLVPVDSGLWHERLAFRDYLRRYPDVAREYAALKQALAARYRFDRDAYTEAKGPFVTRITALALAR